MGGRSVIEDISTVDQFHFSASRMYVRESELIVLLGSEVTLGSIVLIYQQGMVTRSG